MERNPPGLFLPTLMQTFYGFEDLDQSIRLGTKTNNSVSEPAYKSLASQFVDSALGLTTVHLRQLHVTSSECCPLIFLPSNPLAGLGVGIATYKAPEDQSKRVAAIVTELVRTGFRHSDIVILSMYGLGRATFAREKRIGAFTLSRPTGEYDLLGDQCSRAVSCVSTRSTG